jgi:hypothetical protein
VGYSISKRWATSENLLPLTPPHHAHANDALFHRYFAFLTECTTPKACTILLRGPSKDILNEIDRNLADAMSVARNVVFNPTLVPGGGAVEMAISVGLHARARAVTGVEAGPFRAVADALEVIPRTLVQNAGGNVIRALTALRVRLPFFSFPFLGFLTILSLFWTGKTCERRALVGYRRRDGRYRGHENVQVVRICQRQGSFRSPSYPLSPHVTHH